MFPSVSTTHSKHAAYLDYSYMLENAEKRPRFTSRESIRIFLPRHKLMERIAASMIDLRSEYAFDDKKALSRRSSDSLSVGTVLSSIGCCYC